MVKIRKPLLELLIVTAVVFFASLLGILTRPLGFLAAFWPANALLLGTMVRFPHLASPAGWIGAVIGYFAADLITGGAFVGTSWLTFGNLTGVAIGYLLFRRSTTEDLRLQSPVSVLNLFAICFAAAVGAAVVGSFSAPIIFEKSWEEAFGFWFVTELVNSIVVLPVFFTVPRRFWNGTQLSWFKLESWKWEKTLPLLVLLGSVGLGMYVAGPGAIAFPIPALLWCAVSYSLFSSVLLTMLLCSWLLITISAGIMHVPLDDDFMHSMTSLRLGVTLLALGPLAVASINRARNDLLEKLHDAADHDDLTRALSRRAFFEKGTEAVVTCRSRSMPLSVLMLDIDFFKEVNDQHGHTVGDQVLARFVSVVSEVLRDRDMFGRLGGEEFGILLPGMGSCEASEEADRIRMAVREEGFVLDDNSEIRMTVSIGVATMPESGARSLEELTSLADDALYRAKESGRDNVVSVLHPPQSLPGRRPDKNS
ncbi:diguanylate cyclase [Verrucomicrobiales bacterium BCK34]|nr:diguanylate cyclase [Verrucomicrobiales bacterium BCK34]